MVEWKLILKESVWKSLRQSLRTKRILSQKLSNSWVQMQQMFINIIEWLIQGQWICNSSRLYELWPGLMPEFSPATILFVAPFFLGKCDRELVYSWRVDIVLLLDVHDKQSVCGLSFVGNFLKLILVSFNFRICKSDENDDDQTVSFAFM